MKHSLITAESVWGRRSHFLARSKEIIESANSQFPFYPLGLQQNWSVRAVHLAEIAVPKHARRGPQRCCEPAPTTLSSKSGAINLMDGQEWAFVEASAGFVRKQCDSVYPARYRIKIYVVWMRELLHRDTFGAKKTRKAWWLHPWKGSLLQIGRYWTNRKDASAGRGA